MRGLRLTVLSGLVLLALGLGACATTRPFAEDLLQSAESGLTPSQAVQDGKQGVTVFWGGVIVGASNRQDHTDLTILAYPLKSSQRPDRGKPPLGRFIARYPGYLETVVYTAGRELTVLGPLQGIETGTVGKATYRYPVIKAEKMYLWSDKDDSKVRFGIGVGIGVHL